MRMDSATDITGTVRDTALHANANFAAVLLAGGRSTRMGRDKAAVLINGTPLWQLQLDKLRALHPAELYISGRRDGPFAAAGVEIVEDESPDLGPLGGIAATLARMTSPRLLVLAIDLPAMTPAFLRSLFGESGCLIPQRGDFFEPLAAVYPKAATALAQTALQRTDRSMQRFCRELVAADLAHPQQLAATALPYFRNLNEPRDLAPD